nr:CinA family protein [Leucobacter soli]
MIRLATDRRARIAVAESLTGGLLAAELVSVPGASIAFSGGVVAYDTALKRTLLGVDGGLLAERGPVDAEVARQMARGVRQACAAPRAEAAGSDPVELSEADFGVATTGVAGPDPDPQTGQPAGTVWLGISSSRGSRAVELHLGGTRAQIRASSVEAALTALLDELTLQT